MALISCKDCRAVISASATNCPHCGAPTPAKKGLAGRAAIAVLVAFGGVILLGQAIAFIPKDPARDLQIEACTAGEEFVKDRLRSPASATFPSCDEISATQNGDAWTISGYVDATNGFGAKIRSNWIVSAMRPSQDHWFPTNVQIIDR